MSPRPERAVTDAELLVLEALWATGGRATIRTLTDRLHPGGGASRYATVQKLLDRLEAKGCVARDRSVVPHVFTAAVEREDLIDHGLRAVAERYCSGALSPLLSHLLRSGDVRREELDALRRLVDDLDRERRER